MQLQLFLPNHQQAASYPGTANNGLQCLTLKPNIDLKRQISSTLREIPPRLMSHDTQKTDQIAFHFYTKLFYVVNEARNTASVASANGKVDKWVSLVNVIFIIHTN